MEHEKISTSPSEYVVLDVETNGLKSYEHDLLSISIYRPDNENIYNRLLPLELNDEIPKYITEINGIHKKDVRYKKPLSQDEVDHLFSDFELDNRTILTYGELDKRFIRDYFRRHNLIGYDDMKFYNFKEMICTSPFSHGEASKDNLCKMYGIKGVTETHSGINDCHLEWELFNRIDGHQLILTNGGNCWKVFELNENYIMPVSYLKYSHMNKYFEHPKIKCHTEEIQRFEISNKGIVRFENNISGIAIEHLLNTMLKVAKIDSSEFLVSNKSRLNYLGKIPSIAYVIPMLLNEDGTMTAERPADRAFVKTVSDVNLNLKSLLQPIVDFITNDIFHNPNQIFSQELSIDERGIFALCDLSTKDAVLEIKTNNKQDINYYAEQLFYEAQGRESYLLTMDWSQQDKITFIFTRVYPYIKSKNINEPKSRKTNKPKSREDSKKVSNESKINDSKSVINKPKIIENKSTKDSSTKNIDINNDKKDSNKKNINTTVSTKHRNNIVLNDHSVKDTNSIKPATQQKKEINSIKPATQQKKEINSIKPAPQQKKERQDKGETMPRKPVVSRTFDISVYDVYCAELDPKDFKHIEVRINRKSFKLHGGAEQFKAYLPENCYPLRFEKVRDEVDVFEMPEEQFLKEATITKSYIL